MRVAALWMLAAGCAVEPTTGTIQSNVTSYNGQSLNGISLNGKSLNGISLNGISLNGMSLNGISLNGSELVGASLDGSAMVGATMTGQLDDGTSLQLRVDGASLLAPPNDDVWSYDVSYSQDGTTWSSLCPEGAIALAGTWNYQSGVPGGGGWTPSDTQFTFGCRGTALAKCVELGYKPWQSVDGASLRDYHQACTRMLRADYCGDGTPYTFNGWQLDVSDAFAIQTPTPGLTGWTFEAHWTSSGAPCMSSYRALDLVLAGASVPACVTQRLATTCSADFSDGSLLSEQFNPWSLSAALNGALTQYPSAQVQLQMAIDSATSAVNLLAATPPDPVDAAQQVQQAVQSIQVAIGHGVPAAFADELMLRYTNDVRSLVTAGIATAQSGQACANADLASGDAKAAAVQYPAAVIQYRNALQCLE